MKKLFLVLFLAVTGFSGTSAPAMAWEDKRDMFYDKQWINDRPWVKSDSVRGEEMFHRAGDQVFLHSGKDLFESLERRAPTTNNEMFRPFTAKPMPYSRVFTNDEWTR